MSYFEHDGSCLVTCSAGGAKKDPQWIRNLRTAPTAHIQIGATEMDVNGEVCDDVQRAELWHDVVVARAPLFAKHEQKSGRFDPDRAARTDTEAGLGDPTSPRGAAPCS